jgi:cytochrome c oxidase subunit 2
VVSQEEYQSFLDEQQSESSGDLEPDADVVRAHDESLAQAPIRA